VKNLADPGCRQEILMRIRRVRAELPRKWGKMNAPQMVCHLNDSFLCVMGEREVSVATDFRAPRLVKWLALNFPRHWPQGVPTRPEIDQQKSGTPPAEFASDVETLLGLVERFTRKPRDFQFHPHPMFREMTEREWMRWGYLHTDHHLRQFGV
jgi:hypothetical protein